MTGTLTLKAAAPFDIDVPLQSNNTNATVLPSVTVPQGDTSVKFQVQTGSNGGGSVATITAFYAQAFQAQLNLTQ